MYFHFYENNSVINKEKETPFYNRFEGHMEHGDRLGTMALLLPTTIRGRSNRCLARLVQSVVLPRFNLLQVRPDILSQGGRSG